MNNLETSTVYVHFMPDVDTPQMTLSNVTRVFMDTEKSILSVTCQNLQVTKIAMHTIHWFTEMPNIESESNDENPMIQP